MAANGRFITRGICADKKIDQLSDDTSRLAFTWLITFADCEGRTYGDPAVVRSMLFPRRQDISIERMEGYIKEWAEKEMIIWYEAEGDLWIWFPHFDKHQTGLRKDHEAASKIPPYSAEAISNEGATTAELRSSDVVETAQIKLSQVKLSGTPSFSPFVQQAQKIYTDVTGRISLPSGEYTEILRRMEDLERAGKMTVEYLSPYWLEQKARNPHTPQSYFLDWAVAGEIPPSKNGSKPARKVPQGF